jgi:hypothetical protein
MQRVAETIDLARTFKEVTLKNRSISRVLKFASPILVVCVVLAFGVPAVAQARIQGSWIFTLTPGPEGGPAGPGPFTAVASFAAGGVFLATGQNDRGVVPVSELHGSWQRIAPDLYGSTTYFFAFDPTGHAVGMLQTNQVFHLTSRNTLVGAANASFCDLQGENCVPLPGVSAVVGKRMIVKDLPNL